MTLALLAPCFFFELQVCYKSVAFAKSTITVSIAHSKYYILTHTKSYPMHLFATGMVGSSNHVTC